MPVHIHARPLAGRGTTHPREIPRGRDIHREHDCFQQHHEARQGFRLPIPDLRSRRAPPAQELTELEAALNLTRAQRDNPRLRSERDQWRSGAQEVAMELIQFLDRRIGHVERKQRTGVSRDDVGKFSSVNELKTLMRKLQRGF